MNPSTSSAPTTTPTQGIPGPAPAADPTGTAPGFNAGGTPTTTTPTDPEVGRITFTEAQLAERLARKEAQVLARVQQQQAEKDAAAQADHLRKQGEFQTLLNTLEPKLAQTTAQLETVQAERDALRAHVSDHVTKQTKDWPADFKKLVPETDDALARWSGYQTAADLYAKYGQQPTQPGQATAPQRIQGAVPSPRPSSAPPKTQVDQEIERLAKGGMFARG